MQRASAVAYLMDRRHRSLEQIDAMRDEDHASARREIDLLDRLILDVRAARVCTFQFSHPQAVAIYISED